MSQILVRDLEPQVVAKLKERAKRNRRSLQAEVRVVLEELARREEARDSFWEFADKMREESRGMAQSDSADLIREDRDR
jgi:plasmid stability protein